MSCEQPFFIIKQGKCEPTFVAPLIVAILFFLVIEVLHALLFCEKKRHQRLK